MPEMQRVQDLLSASSETNANLRDKVSAGAGELAQRTAELADRTAELAQRSVQLEQRTRELEERTRQLEEVNARLESFCYSVSHDLRSPLQALRLQCTVIERLAKSGKDLTEALDVMRKATERAVQLASELLDCCRGPAPRSQPATPTWARSRCCRYW